jgi:hypothetical protein
MDIYRNEIPGFAFEQNNEPKIMAFLGGSEHALLHKGTYEEMGIWDFVKTAHRIFKSKSS